MLREKGIQIDRSLATETCSMFTDLASSPNRPLSLVFWQEELVELLSSQCAQVFAFYSMEARAFRPSSTAKMDCGVKQLN